MENGAPLGPVLYKQIIMKAKAIQYLLEYTSDTRGVNVSAATLCKPTAGSSEF